MKEENPEDWFVPVSKHDIVMNGQIGSIMGFAIINVTFNENLPKIVKWLCYFQKYKKLKRQMGKKQRTYYYKSLFGRRYLFNFGDMT